MKFSDRNGITKQKNVIQREGIDEPMKNKLWNVFFTYFVLPIQNDNNNLLINTEGYRFFVNLWHNFFEKPVDTIPEDKTVAINCLRTYFFEAKWFEIYNFLEFIASKNEVFDYNKFKDSINIVLETELSAYRFINDAIVLVENDDSIKENAKIDNNIENCISEVEARLKNIKMEAEVRKPVTTEFMLTAIEPFDIENQLNVTDEVKKENPNIIIESTKTVKDKLGLRSDDRDAFLTIKSKPARASIYPKAVLDEHEKQNSEIVTNQSIQANHRDKSTPKKDDESSEKQDELDKAIQILKQKHDTKINLGNQ